MAAFGIFRRPQNPGDLEDEVAPGLPATARFGLVVAEVRRIPVTAALPAWVTPGSSGAALSMRSRDRAGGFSTATWSGPVESVARDGLFGWSVSLDGIETYCGLVPDGNDRVELTLIDQTCLVAPVVENVFVARPKRSVRTLLLRDVCGQPARKSTGI